MNRMRAMGRRLAAEWRLVHRDRALWGALAVFLACLAYASVSGAMWLRGREAETAEVAGAAHDGATGHASGRGWVVLPLTALTMLSIGQSDVHATALRIRIGDRETVIPGTPLGNPLAHLLGRFDFSFVIIVLAPLIVIAASYDVLAGDREAGRLALAVAGGATIGGLVAARLTLRAGLVGICAVAVPMAAVVSHGGVTASDLPFVVLWALVVLAYVGFWAAAAGLANAWGARAATCLVALVVVWTVLVVAAPALLRLVAAAMHPTPSRPALVVAMWGTVTPDVPTFYAAMHREDDRLRALVASFEEEVARQQDMVGRWRFVSPALVAREAFDAIAGTGVDRYRAFVAQVDRYRTASLQPGLPAFAFAEPPRAAPARSVLVGLAALLAAATILGVATRDAARRVAVIA